MKNVTTNFKNKIKSFGREISAKITIGTTTISNSSINRISLSYDGAILKSVMKVLEIDSNVDIAKDTWINFQFGVKVGSTYEYIDYGNFKVVNSEKQEDTNSYKITCYDKIIEFMKDYEFDGFTFPMTLGAYLYNICSSLGITTTSSPTFANATKQLTYDPFLDATNKSLGYTYRDILDQIAEASGGTICINDNNELEVRYINDTYGDNIVDLSGISSTTTNGVTITNNQDGTIKLNGTCSANFIVRNTAFTLKQGKYKISANTNFVSNDTDNYVSVRVGNTTSNISGSTTTYTQENKFSVFTNNTNQSVRFTIRITKNTVLNNVVIRPTLQPLYDTIDGKSLKDINVNFGEVYGPVNSVVLSRSANADNIYLRDEQSVTTNGLCEIKIVDNQIMNGNDRDEYLTALLNVLNGLTYCINDFSSTGICYLDLCDKYNIVIDQNTYSCIMLNDEINIESGLEENIYTKMPEQSDTDYDKADKTDRKINQAYAMVDKQNQTITNLVSTTTQQQELNDQRILELQERTNSVIQTLTSQQATIEVMQRDIIAGQETLQNSLVTININGINVSTNTSAITTLMSNDKFEIRRSGYSNPLAFIGYDEETGQTKSEMDNLLITNYFTVGFHRVEKFRINAERRTGWFYND